MAALLRPIDVDALRRAQNVPPIAGKPLITLAGAVELACTIAASDTDRSMLAEAATGWLGELTLWRHMQSWLIDGSRPPRPTDATSAPLAEFWAIDSEDDVAGTEWALFQDRFRRSG